MAIKTLGEIAKLVKGEVLGDSDVQVSNISGIDDVEYGEMTWAEKEKAYVSAAESAASAVLVPRDVSAFPKPAVRVDNPRLAFAILLELFNPPRQFPEGVHPSAVVAAGCRIGEGAYIGPNCTVEEGASIGRRAVLYGNVFVGQKAKIGEASVLHPGVAVREGVQIGKNVIIHAGSVIGSDGFGFVTAAGKHRKMPQVGTVVVQDDVEIGSNCTIDRATTGRTLIGRGSKLDNLIQIAHNVVIGEDCLIVAQVGIAGSTVLGNRVTLAGQAGVAGHLSIGESTVVAAKSAVMGDLPSGSFVSGIPARPHKDELKVKASTRRLPDLLKRVGVLESRLQEIERREAELDVD